MTALDLTGRPASLRRFLDPSSIALFGASDDDTRLRGKVTRLIVQNGYAGKLHFINPSRQEIAGRPCHQTLDSVDEPIDLAIIVVPADNVLPALQQCRRALVGHALIMSSGFAEEGGAKALLQQRIAEIAAGGAMRVCGPNAEGFHNETARLSATFSPAVEIAPEEVFAASPRRIGVIAQSGGVGFALYHRGRHLGLSFSSVVTTGNEVDLTAADFLAHMAQDDDTAAILLFLETVRDGPGFTAALAAAAAAHKPVVVIKVGRSTAGSRATVSHTGSMAGAGAAYDAMFARYGVTVADDLGRALAIVAGFVTNPLPRGNRGAVVTVSGGAGALAADRLTAHGVQVPELSANIQRSIRGLIPSYGATANPVDVTGQATRTGAPLRTIELLSDGDEVDFVVMASTMSNRTRPPVDVEGLAVLVAQMRKPIFFFTYTLPSPYGLRALAGAGMITFTSIDDVAAAVMAMLAYGRFLQAGGARCAGPVLPRGPLGLPDGVLVEHAAKALLQADGIAMPRSILVPDEAGCAAVPDSFFPVAAKIQSAGIPHKTEAQGVRIGIADTQTLRQAVSGLRAAAARLKPDAVIDGVLVEPMARRGIEMIVGSIRDPHLGSVVTVGAGGVTAELTQDTAHLLGPVDVDHAMQMIRSLRSFPLLNGYRGSPACDVAALAQLVVSMSMFAACHAADIAEVELNPVVVHALGEGVTIIDALIVIGRHEPAGFIA